MVSRNAERIVQYEKRAPQESSRVCRKAFQIIFHKEFRKQGDDSVRVEIGLHCGNPSCKTCAESTSGVYFIVLPDC